MKKVFRYLSILLACALLLSFAAFAADGETSRHPDALQRMMDCGFFRGSDKGLELDRSLTRSEAAALVVRVMGAETDLPSPSMPFTDVADWAARYVSYLYNAGAVRGVSASRFGANDPVTGQQFYTMLLRVLGYDDTRGDFTYAGALDFAVSKGLLDAAEAARVRSAFVRDDAAYACYRALTANPKGKTTAYALQRGSEIGSSYSLAAAQVVCGTNQAYETLLAASKAVGALDSLTIAQHGKYRKSGTVRSDDSVETVVRLFPKAGECYFTLDIEDRTNGAVTLSRHAEAYSDGSVAVLWSDGEWQTVELDEAASGLYAGIYDRLFGPDLTYATNFDCAQKDGVIELTGFLNRFDLLGDPTSSMETNYYFDITLRFDAATHLPLSVSCSYRDTWQTSGGPAEVEYSSEYEFLDLNATEMPADTHGLSAALGR